MNRSRLRTMLAVLVILIAGTVVGIELRESFDEASPANGIRKLESIWPARRKTGAKMLGQFSADSETVVPALVKSLADSNADVRLAALESLEVFRAASKPAGSVARELLSQDSDSRVRRQAASLLRVIGDKDAAPILVKSLSDADPVVRAEATRTLGAFGPSVATVAVIETLLAALDVKSPADLREASIETLDIVAQDQERVARAIADAAVHDKSAGVRKRAVDTLKKPKFDFQIAAMIAALDDSDAQVRLSAVNKLCGVGVTDDRVLPALCRAALNADASTREGIGTNLDFLVLDKRVDAIPDEALKGRLEVAARELQKVIESPTVGTREHMIDLLGRIIIYYQRTGRTIAVEPARVALEAVLKRLDDEKEDPGLRVAVVDQWWAIERKQSSNIAIRDEVHARSAWLVALSRALKSYAPEVRHRAGEVLLMTSSREVSDPEIRDAWRETFPALVDAASGDDGKIRLGAIAILRQFGPEAAQALPALRALAENTRDGPLKPEIEDAIRSISAVEDTKSKNFAARIEAAQAIGRLGWRARAALPALVALLKDPEIKVRAAVAGALQNLGAVGASAVPQLAERFAGETDAHVRFTLLQALDAVAPGTPEVIATHVKALDDSDATVRVAAAGFASVPADEKAFAALVGHLGDPSEEVRTKVAGTLCSSLFQSSAVAPVLLAALHDQTQRKPVVEAIVKLLDRAPEPPDLRRARVAALSTLIPAMKDARTNKDEEIKRIAYRVLGRVLSFSRLSRDQNLHKAIEPALALYLDGLKESDPAIREEVLGHVGSVGIGHKDISLSLNKFLEQPERPENEREQAQLALKELAAPPLPRRQRPN